ncbi:hypothetical protein AB5I41_08185 [Sphingomonas sp. MMS24-JH45]
MISALGDKLAANVENMTRGDRHGRGASAYGNAAANVIKGDGRDNVIDGGAGSDTLSGGGGRDAFVFDTAAQGADRIAGMTSARTTCCC